QVPPAPKKGGKGGAATPAKAPAAPAAPPPPPVSSDASAPAPQGIFASTFPAEGEAKKRTRLYAMIAAAAVILAVGAWLVVRKPSAAPVAPKATPAPAVV